ncbi:MAG: hypothetical protein Q8S09_00380 [Hyphomonas sp.]|nr:hypothetical protein [Hyphomonas sp.]
MAMDDAAKARALALGQRVLDAVAGEPTPVALLAVTDALATLIGWGHHSAGGTVHQALETADQCAERIDAHIVQGWGKIQRGGADG